MTRPIVYNLALGVYIVATFLTLTSILTPNWLTYDVTAENSDATFSRHMGLHQICSSTDDPACRHYPDETDCRGDQFFCSAWRTSGFLMSFATVIELATVVSFFVVIVGGKYKMELGWKVIVVLLLSDAVVEFTGMGIVAHLLNHDKQFTDIPDWKMGYSWTLCTVSACLSVLLAMALAASAYALPPEDDYEFLEDPVNDI